MRVRAFSIVEAVLCLAILGGAGLALLTAIGRSAQAAVIARDRDTAGAIADMVLADVMSTPHVDPGGNLPTALTGLVLGITPFGPMRATPDRETITRLIDYTDRIESPPQLRDGTPIDDYAGWSVKVEFAHVNPADLTTSVSFTGLARVSVLVANRDSVVLTRSVLRSTAWDAFRPAAEDMP